VPAEPPADQRCGVDDKKRLILDQALALVDEQGLAAMSMRAVAQRVGLTSMALYPYVGGKDALLDGLVDLLHLELGAACADPGHLDWRQRLRALGRAVRALAREHPWLTAALRGVLHDAGVAADDEARLARMICAFLLGYTTGEITGGLPGSLPGGSPGGLPGGLPGGPPGGPVGGPLGSGAPSGSGGSSDHDATDAAGESEFDADLEDLIRLVEVNVRGR
jgi:AcrR family transcriptional regulator